MRRATLALTLLSVACSTLAQDEGWNFTPGNGATTKQDANFLALAASFEDDDPRLPIWWQSFKKTFYKKYPTSDLTEEVAYKNFQGNLNLIFGINSDLALPFWNTGNQYADYDLPTFRERYLMTNLTDTLGLDSGTRRLLTDQPIPEHELTARRRLQGSSVDWRNSGKLTPVKDQGGCGSCWAYAATCSIEAAYNMFVGLSSSQTLINLSEQQLIECNGKGSSCNGGSSDDAIRYAASAYMTTEDRYPATFRDGSCHAPANPPAGAAVRLAGVTNYPPTQSESALMAAVAKQPTVIYFEVVGDFFSYSGGVYVPSSCGTAINHAMVAVGYQYTGNPSSSYWIIRNSWGGSWGLNGYIYVRMTGTSQGPCGMYQYIFQPPVDFSLTMDNGPIPVASPPPRAPGAPKSPGSPDTPSQPDYPDYPNEPASPPPRRSPPPKAVSPPPKKRSPPPRRASPSPPPGRRPRAPRGPTAPRPPRPPPRAPAALLPPAPLALLHATPALPVGCNPTILYWADLPTGSPYNLTHLLGPTCGLPIRYPTLPLPYLGQWKALPVRT